MTTSPAERRPNGRLPRELFRGTPDVLLELELRVTCPVDYLLVQEVFDGFRDLFSMASFNYQEGRFFVALPPCMKWVVWRRTRPVLARHGFSPDQLVVRELGPAPSDRYAMLDMVLNPPEVPE